MLHCPECGVLIEDEEKAGKPRSLEQHRRFFKIVRLVFLHWPHTHPRQFATETECRKWLQMRADYKEPKLQLPLMGMSKEHAVMLAEAAIRSVGEFGEPVVEGGNLVIYVPKSISFKSLGHLAFCALNDKVADVIEAETGLKVDVLLAEARRAA
jgi:hypothetical protein